jgi:hypothetical protein
MLVRMWGKRTSYPLLVWKSGYRDSSKKLKMELSYDSTYHFWVYT